METCDNTPNLLTIPGELRNKIYRLILHDEAYEEGYFHRRLPHHFLPPDRYKYRVILTFDPSIEDVIYSSSPQLLHLRGRDTGAWYAGLTHTCRLLRAEFRPMWLSERRISVPLSRVGVYLQQPHLKVTKLHDLASRFGHVRLTGLPTMQDGPIDVLALLRAFKGRFNMWAEYQQYDWICRLEQRPDIWQPLVDDGHLLALTSRQEMVPKYDHDEKQWQQGDGQVIQPVLSSAMGALCSNENLGAMLESLPAALKNMICICLPNSEKILSLTCEDWWNEQKSTWTTRKLVLYGEESLVDQEGGLKRVIWLSQLPAQN